MHLPPPGPVFNRRKAAEDLKRPAKQYTYKNLPYRYTRTSKQRHVHKDIYQNITCNGDQKKKKPTQKQGKYFSMENWLPRV